MRLSELLNEAPDTGSSQVENFLGYRKVGWGLRKAVSIGKVVRNYHCLSCKGSRSFVSGDKLSCLVSTNSSVSLDVVLRCSGCGAGAETWFLVACDSDLYAQAPIVHLQRFADNIRGNAGRYGLAPNSIDDLFERAQVAFEDGLGAGSMVYLRKIFELVTSEVAIANGLATENRNGKRRDFRSLLREVDEVSHVVPREFADNGYKLFGELSDVVHGASDETEALEKFEPCRRLVFGVVSSVRNREQYMEAMASLGWSDVV